MSTPPLAIEYRYLLDSRWLFVPKSKQAALRGVEAGFLPEAALVFRGVNIRPIFEEPYDLLELEKVLANPDLSLETVELLMKIFGLMTRNPDKEIALFAAESINVLEIRCGSVVQALRRTLEATPGPGAARAVFQGLYGLAVVNKGRPVLRAFYLKEALAVLEQLWVLTKPDAADLPLAVQIHLDLDQPREAEALIERFIAETPQEPSLYVLMARVKFSRGDYLQVMTLLRFLKGDLNLPGVDQIYRFWVGEDRG